MDPYSNGYDANGYGSNGYGPQVGPDPSATGQAGYGAPQGVNAPAGYQQDPYGQGGFGQGYPQQNMNGNPASVVGAPQMPTQQGMYGQVYPVGQGGYDMQNTYGAQPYPQAGYYQQTAGGYAGPAGATGMSAAPNGEYGATANVGGGAPGMGVAPNGEYVPPVNEPLPQFMPAPSPTVPGVPTVVPGGLPQVVNENYVEPRLTVVPETTAAPVVTQEAAPPQQNLSQSVSFVETPAPQVAAPAPAPAPAPQTPADTKEEANPKKKTSTTTLLLLLVVLLIGGFIVAYFMGLISF